MPRPASKGMLIASVRDFGGGWNVADAEYNLSSRFLPVADNIAIGIDNTLSPRSGYAFKYNFRNGTVYSPVNITANITTFTAGYVTLTITGHGFSNGNHITLSGIASAINGIPAAELNRTHGVYVVDANTLRIQTRTTAASASAVSTSYTYVRDTHTLAGNIIESAFFQDYVIAMDDNGEIARVHPATDVISQLWNISLAYATAGNPRGWGPCSHFSYDTWKQTLVVVNGRLNDKPIEIDNTRPSLGPTQYLVDPATSSNTFVYSADYVLTHSNYMLLIGANNPNTPSTNTPTMIEISAAGTNGVFTSNPAPDDAVQIDISKVTSTVDPRITGVSTIRDNVFISLYDTALLGQLGIYSGAIHKPEFKDQLPQHGSLNHRVIHNIGNDLFMCDYAGVPAFSQSSISSVIVPERLSQLIDPAINKHFSRLSNDTLRYDAWAVFNTRDRQYMLSVPKFDSSSAFNLREDGIYCVSDLSPYSVVIGLANNHGLSAGDYVTVSGATTFSALDAADINGERRVVGIVDENTFLFKVGAIPTVSGINGGGSSINIAPINDENIMYVYQYNPSLKIRRWTRYRQLKFDTGCRAKDGTIYFFRDGKCYEWGTSDKNYHADELNEYDSVWAAATAYTVGKRVRQTTGAGTTYVCIVAHTSTGTFADDVETSENWEIYKGLPISWVAETPWSDYGKRLYKKINKYLTCDSTGTGKFRIDAFVDNIYRELLAEELSSASITDYAVYAATQSFIGGDAGGFGAGEQSYGLGLRTREQHNYEFPFECKFAKLRYSGATTEKLRIVASHMLYQLGSIYR